MSLIFGLFTQVSDSGPHGPLVSELGEFLFSIRTCILFQHHAMRHEPGYDHEIETSCHGIVEDAI